MDVVLALTIKWEDKRLRWNKYEWGRLLSIPVNTIQVSSDEIWTPRTDFQWDFLISGNTVSRYSDPNR